MSLSTLTRLSKASIYTSAIKSQSVKKCLFSLKDGPAPALTLGAGGLIPFVSAPAYMIQMNEFMPLVS